jgi:hypothetical protein
VEGRGVRGGGQEQRYGGLVIACCNEPVPQMHWEVRELLKRSLSQGRVVIANCESVPGVQSDVRESVGAEPCSGGTRVSRSHEAAPGVRSDRETSDWSRVRADS